MKWVAPNNIKGLTKMNAEKKLMLRKSNEPRTHAQFMSNSTSVPFILRIYQNSNTNTD